MKNLFFSLLVVGVAVAGSAFTNQKGAQYDYYTQAADGDYVLTTPAQWNPESCGGISEETCAFRQMVTDSSIPSRLTPTQVQTYLNTIPAKLEKVKDLSGDPILGFYNPE